ncbi:MAG: flagellar basal body rod protein FlgC [Rhodospirillales bacterium]|nr:flagellar basal body rod protein FlgC [Rhodospirillales bacterium]MCB9965281.1 flagellar basal body rod protein FlgC [Rhodospirillales bacterium]MCB9972950.1 flagellar basal body rod protein FlgC [Rhodospirillales bacterium]MCB9980112.1 flagellar basal body rod protein FlgC [Rhodospirillales bacterium]
MDNLFGAMTASSYGMRAQSERIRMLAENVANAESAAGTPNEDPYKRKRMVFKNEMDKQLGIDLVKVDKIVDKTDKPFPLKFMPDHPGADANGYVKMPNINPIIEMADFREAQRSYEANLGMIEQSRAMAQRTVDILRA